MTAQKRIAKQQIDLPGDGVITLADFAALPEPSRRWVWELHEGRLELRHAPVTGWHWLVVLAALEYWRDRGHAILGEQYVADSGFLRGGSGKNHFVVDGVVFRQGYKPNVMVATHDAADVYTVIEAVSADGESRDSGEKLTVFVQLGVSNYWIIREVSDSNDDGAISMYELVDGAYQLSGTCMVSQLAAADSE